MLAESFHWKSALHSPNQLLGDKHPSHNRQYVSFKLHSNPAKKWLDSVLFNERGLQRSLDLRGTVDSGRFYTKMLSYPLHKKFGSCFLFVRQFSFRFGLSDAKLVNTLQRTPPQQAFLWSIPLLPEFVACTCPRWSKCSWENSVKKHREPVGHLFGIVVLSFIALQQGVCRLDMRWRHKKQWKIAPLRGSRVEQRTVGASQNLHSCTGLSNTMSPWQRSSCCLFCLVCGALLLLVRTSIKQKLGLVQSFASF